LENIIKKGFGIICLVIALYCGYKSNTSGQLRGSDWSMGLLIFGGLSAYLLSRKNYL